MIIRITSCTIAFVCCLHCIATAQVSSEIWLRVSGENPWSRDTAWMRYGNHINGTYGPDSLNPSLKEMEGWEPSMYFDVLWVDIPGRQQTHGVGFRYYDFRGLPNVTGRDTFVLWFMSAAEPSTNFTILWPDSNYLRTRCDSMFMVDPTGQIAKVNMFSQDSLYLHAPGALDLPVTKLRIFKYGCKLVDDVASPAIGLPLMYSLAQNYPNPFNPVTHITYSIPVQSFVKIIIYDMLGREVSMLVNGKQEPGEYSIQWNAEGIPSGVYFYRLLAGDFSQTKEMLLIR
jgi:hypothetical protein